MNSRKEATVSEAIEEMKSRRKGKGGIEVEVQDKKRSAGGART